jgi:hypothetical protein
MSTLAEGSDSSPVFWCQAIEKFDCDTGNETHHDESFVRVVEVRRWKGGGAEQPADSIQQIRLT